jgi:PucR-like helix-turn-helix protein/diguanylate cyclase with GGDEF domain/purine catabolism regulatory family protein
LDGRRRCQYGSQRSRWAILLAQEELGLELLTGGEAVHADSQRGLIAELEGAGVAALGFGVEVVYKRVPPAALEEAQARSFPVFSIPLPTPFREVISMVNRALASSDLRALQRLSSMQLYLMDALGENDPQRAVLGCLASFVDATALLLAPDGRLESATGAAPADEIWRAIAERPAGLAEFEVDGWWALAIPVAAGQGPTRWLALTSRRAGWVNRLTRPAARATAPVLAALTRLEGAAQEQERVIRGSLLEQLLKPMAPRDASTLAARAASLGIDFTRPARIVLVRRHADADGGSRVDLGGVCHRLEQRLGHVGLRHLVARRPGAVVGLVQGERDPLRSAIAELIEEEPGVAAGIGRPLRTIEAIRDSLRDAEIAVKRLAHAEVRVLDFEDFDLGTLVISEAPAERIQPKVEQFIGVLRENPALHEAVVSYFEHGMDAMRTAEAMHLHHNSLRYRLGRVEQFLGRSLKDPATIASLYIALIAAPPGGKPELSGTPDDR